MQNCTNCKELFAESDLNDEQLCYTCFCIKNGLYDFEIEREG